MYRCPALATAIEAVLAGEDVEWPDMIEFQRLDDTCRPSPTSASAALHDPQ